MDDACSHPHVAPTDEDAFTLTCADCGALVVPIVDTQDQVVLATITTDTELLDPVED